MTPVFFPKKTELFVEWHLFRLVERIIFKKNCPKRTFPSDFIEFGSEILLFVFGRKMVVCFVCLFFFLFFFVVFFFVCCNFSDFGFLFLIEALIELRKILRGKTDLRFRKRFSFYENTLPTISADSDLKFNKILARIQPQYHVTQLVVTWYNTLLADWSMPYNSRNRKYTLVVFSAEKCRNRKPPDSI